MAGFPLLAEAADGFAEAHGKSGDGFHALLAPAREESVVLAADFSEEEFRVAENAGERIVELVAEDFAEVFAGGRQSVVEALAQVLSPRTVSKVRHQSERRTAS